MTFSAGHWLISGASSGLGLALCEAALASGGRVSAGARSSQALDNLKVLGANPLALDVTQPASIEAAAMAAETAHGPIDVLVNNAGVGLLSSVEAASDAEVRALFDINFFGLAALTRAVLPSMRGRRRGAIINISSVAGLCANPGSSYYCASKFAVEGLSEALRGEVAPFGIHVMVVEPGAFRTNFSGNAQMHAARHIDDYQGLMEQRRKLNAELHGNQAGDPRRGAKAIVAALDRPSPPRQLPLGGSVVARTIRKWHDQIASFESEAGVAAGADVPPGA